MYMIYIYIYTVYVYVSPIAAFKGPVGLGFWGSKSTSGFGAWGLLISVGLSLDLLLIQGVIWDCNIGFF